jgi:hypothetical protein
MLAGGISPAPQVSVSQATSARIACPLNGPSESIVACLRAPQQRPGQLRPLGRR